VRRRVVAARDHQHARYGPEGPRTNADLKGGGVAKYCRPGNEGRLLLLDAAKRLGLTARGHDRVLKVARTIADLAGSQNVLREHVAEALQYRLLE
jgi:magnesium chelatase family protein